MSTYVQAERAMTVATPLGPDALLLTSFTGSEAISQLFNYSLGVIAENSTDVAFDKLLGQKITINLSLPDGSKRHFNGICNRISQGEQDNFFTTYRLEIVPQFWRLTKRVQSRIFQHISVPDILKKVLDGIDVSYEIQGTFHPRDYCVQYRESDFAFASRLMEEEGIFYFFKHTTDGHKMVVANTSQSHPDLPGDSRIIYEKVEGGNREENRIFNWEKAQELRSGKYTLWDHCFELPGKHLEAEHPTLDSITTGGVTHKLKVGNNDDLEIYDYPGGYSQRFDGIDRDGGNRAGDLQKIFQDNKRTVELRMQAEEQASLLIQACSNCQNLFPGHKFTLERHFNADGEYVITSVEHRGSLKGDYRSNGGDMAEYENSFTCIPLALPFRPPQTTPKPTVQGTQTAIVVGPAGEEIFTDKYGRVKVQFPWDREGRLDSGSSCWARVGTPWAGSQWGAISIPRIGQEVIVDFLEGDPDQPIIIGSVYNADQMPLYELPAHRTRSAIKTRSSPKGGPANFNEIRFEDKKGSEQLFMHAERDLDFRAKRDRREYVGRDSHLIVKENQKQLIKKDRHTKIQGNQVESVDGDKHVKVKGNHLESIDGNMSLTVGGKQNEKVGQQYAMEAGQEIHLKAGMKVILEAGVQLTIKGPGGFVDIGPAGVTISGTMVLINSGGAPGSGSGSSPDTPRDPENPNIADDGTKGDKLG